MNTYDTTVVSQSEAAKTKDVKTFTITNADGKASTFSLTGQQINLLMYTGLGIAGYFLIKSLSNSAVKKLNKDDD